MKRLFDIFLAIIGIILSLPLWLLFGVLIWLQDRGPVFYSQERVGKDGKLFENIQFRSMRTDAERGLGPLQARENDIRITPIGRFIRENAMDALPQLFNILNGQMSFVGPRALRPTEKEVGDDAPRNVWEYKDFSERCKVRPGLTGVAQLLLPRDVPRQMKFCYDLWYIKNRTFYLDLYLIALSFLVTFEGKWGSGRNRLGFLTRKLKKKVDSQILPP